MKDFAFIHDRLDDISRELAVSNYSGFLEETLLKVRKFINDESLHIDFIYHSGSSSDVRKLLASFREDIKINPAINANEINEKSEPVRVFEQYFSSIAIVFFDEDVFNEKNLLNRIQFMYESYKVVIFINFYDDDILVNQVAEPLKSTIKIFTISATGCKGKGLAEVIQKFIDENKLLKLKKLTFINSIKPIFTFLDEIFVTENKVVSTRKLLNSQNTQITRKEEIGYNVSELAISAKQNLQKLTSELEKSYKMKYDELNKPNTGKFSQQSMEFAEKLVDFEKKDMAEKSEKVAIVIRNGFLKSFNDGVVAGLKTELSKDESFIRSSIEELVNRINHQLKLKGLSPIDFDDAVVPFPDQDRVARSFCYFGKQYNGELMKRGVTEYFVALRDYVGVIVVTTGLLAPLNIIANSGSSFETRKAPWASIFNSLKAFSASVRVATAVIALSLIVYGIFDLRRRIPQKREEESGRELVKAKELLLNEAKRMYYESSREWMNNIDNWIKEVNQNVTQQLERNIKEFQVIKASQSNAEKQQQLRLQQSIELIQRNIQSAERVRDQLSLKFADLETEIKRDLKFN